MYKIEITGNTMEEVIAQLHAWDNLANKPLMPPSVPVAPITQPQQYAAPAQPQQLLTPPAPASMPVQQYAPPQQPIPTAAPTYTAKDLMTAGAQLMARVGVPALQQLLARFNVQGINQVPPERYSEFAQALRDMGGTI